MAPGGTNRLIGITVVVGIIVLLDVLSFAILPGLRGMVTREPCGLVRHPANQGELAMLVAAAAGLARPWTAALLVLGPPLFAARILAEERVPWRSDGGRAHARRVRSRLVPGLW